MFRKRFWWALPAALCLLAILVAAFGLPQRGRDPGPDRPRPTSAPTGVPVSPGLRARLSTLTAATPTGATATGTPLPQAFVIPLREVNVRAGPGTGQPVIGSARPDMPLLLLGRTPAGDWWQVEYPQGSGQRAWISAQVVRTEGPAGQASIVSGSEHR